MIECKQNQGNLQLRTISGAKTGVLPRAGRNFSAVKYHVNQNTPCIVGVSQTTVHKAFLPGPEPLVAWRDAARLAAADAGLDVSILSEVNSLALAHCMSWHYADGLALLAAQIDAKPSCRHYGPPSGTSGQTLFDECAQDIRSGRTQIALLCGGESLATVRHYRKQNRMPPWTPQEQYATPSSADFLAHQHPDEWALGLFDGVGAIYSFALRDIARRAHLGIRPDEYRRQLGDMLSSMTVAAARNPLAWSPQERDRDFIIGPRDDNRMIAYPYTKHMVANIDVDMTAAFIMVSERKANELGIPRSKRVYLWASCYAEDPVYIGTRPKLWRSEAMHAAANATLEAANLRMADVKYVDLYSCFAAAVNFGRDALQINDRTGAQITVTGGLPYAGGPASSYVFTSIVAMTRKLREDKKAFGLITGIGMMMTKHAFALYAAQPPVPHVQAIDQERLQAQVSAISNPQIDSAYSGVAQVAAYTLMYDRNGGLSHGAGVCDLPSGRRAYAAILDPQLLAHAERSELVGERFTIRRGQKIGELVAQTAP